jgi:hypothetical protein
MNDTLMPATANGYSQSDRLPSCLNNNLWKDAFILMCHMISNNSALVQRHNSETTMEHTE